MEVVVRFLSWSFFHHFFWRARSRPKRLADLANVGKLPCPPGNQDLVTNVFNTQRERRLDITVLYNATILSYLFISYIALILYIYNYTYYVLSFYHWKCSLM
jgi:hypothetical protein